MATESAKALTFGLLCPECFDQDVSICLNDLAKCTCAGCGTEFTPEEARDAMDERVAAWSKVVAWVESARALIHAET